MSDDLTRIAPDPISGRIAEIDLTRPGTRPKSRHAKLIVGAALLIGVALAAGAVFLLFGQGASTDSSDSFVAVAQNGTPPASTTSPPSGSTPQPPSEVAIDEVFTFRDIFVPLVKPATSSQTSTQPPTPTGTNSSNTILLQDITVENGENTVVLVWNGTTYHSQEGDQIDSSAWKVLQIGTDSVVMLYGDTQVVLSVGQAITK